MTLSGYKNYASLREISSISLDPSIEKISAFFISNDLPSNLATSEVLTVEILFDELTSMIVTSLNVSPSIFF